MQGRIDPTGILLWGLSINDLANGTTPEQVAASHHLWASDIGELGPWERGEDLHYHSRSAVREKGSIIVKDCSSTQDLGWHLVRLDQFPTWSSIIAVRQWQGRGRRGLNWISTAGNLFVTVRLPLPPKPWQNLISLLVGYHLVEALNTYGNQLTSFQLKWPNDLFLEQRKVGGILVEAREDVVLAGIGINIVEAPKVEQMAHDRAFSAISLSGVFEECTPLKLWNYLHKKLVIGYQQSLNQPPELFIDNYRKYIAFLDQDVIIARPEGGRSRVRIVGVNCHGGLLVKTASGVEALNAGVIHPCSMGLDN